MPLSQTNAKLLAIAGEGFTEDFDRLAENDPVRMQTSADAYYRETRQRVNGAWVLTRTLIVSADHPVIKVKNGESLTFRRKGTAESQTLEVVAVEEPTSPLPSGASIVRVTFTDG